jgi:hypothetical protein
MQKLTATAVKQPKSESKPYSMVDGGGVLPIGKVEWNKMLEI